jgi:leader peptidase (prepilin peptidase)/N-methyltransferase
MDPFFVTLGVFTTVLAGVVGALIGSFANVVVYRLPRRESVAFPGSHCPGCDRSLTPLELVPVLSWLLQRGRCRGCRQPISARYPLVELLMAAGFLLIALRWPVADHGMTAFALMLLFAVLLILAFIDLDTFTLPDVLTIPGTLLALLATFVYAGGSGLPALPQALAGAAVGAGVLVLINRLGGLVLRRGDTAERLWPLGFDQVNLAALGGALGGWQAGLLLAAASLLLNLVTRRTLRLSEPVVYALWLLALLLSAGGLTLPPATALGGSVIAAGAAAFAGALYWWLADAFTREPAAPAPPPARAETEAALVAEDEEPVAMGFGDVKLAAFLGAMLGWEKLLLAVLLAVGFGAAAGVAGRLAGGSRVIPFGPHLVLGALVALLHGDALIGWYLRLLGF